MLQEHRAAVGWEVMSSAVDMIWKYLIPLLMPFVQRWSPNRGRKELVHAAELTRACTVMPDTFRGLWLSCAAQLHSLARDREGHTGTATAVPRVPARMEVPSAPPPFFFQHRNLQAPSQRG